MRRPPWRRRWRRPRNSEPIHVALADLPEVETLFFLVGLARAGEKGLDYELTFFNGEELAIQAILAGQADVGLGSPYAVIQNSDVPVRLFQQTSRIIFFPVVNAEIESWQDMDGKSMTYHARGGPLEPLAADRRRARGHHARHPELTCPARRIASWPWSRVTSMRRSSTF